MKTNKFYLKYHRPRTLYYRQVMREAQPNILSAAQIAEACNKLLGIPDGDPLKFTHGNCESALNRMSDTSTTEKCTKPNKTDEHPQGWILVPPTADASQKAEEKRLKCQASRAASKLPFEQRVAALKQYVAILTSE